MILLAALAPAAYSHSILYTFDGDSTNDLFGCDARGAGDGNGHAKAGGGPGKFPGRLVALLALGLVLVALKLWNANQLRREGELLRIGDV